MTTVIVTRKNGKVCIAADSLAKYGSTLESASLIANSDKLVQVGDAWLAPTGPASAQLLLNSYFADEKRARDFSNPQGIFETFVDMQGILKDDYFLNPKEDEHDPFDSLQMEILVASPAGIFGVYPLRSVQEYTRYYAFGSGAEYALGAMHHAYESCPDACSVAQAGLEAATALDDSTAMPITMQEITLDHA
jgi:ATP-dependent protease HslVU (ClpYQ) peptidase subunit